MRKVFKSYHAKKEKLTFMAHKATMGFFSCFRWARALDLGSASPKKTYVFFCPARDWIVSEKNLLIFDGKKNILKKTSLLQEIFPAMFSLLVFFHPH